MSKKLRELPTRLVLVEWLDACEDDATWASLKKIRKQKPVLVKTVGYVVREETDFITMANSVVQDDGMLGGNSTIPRGMIKRVVELTEAKSG